jgi:ABC-2 type transport system permease protein
MMATLLGLLIPTLTLTGFIFPISSLPGWLQPVTNIVPATWYILIARGIMLKGAGLSILWTEIVVLGGMAVVLLALSTRALNDRIE